MRRRDFITLLGGAAAIWPLQTRAQQSTTVRRVAWLGIGTPGTASSYLEGLRAGLSESGWVEGRNLTLSLYWATGFEDMEGVARTLVASKPDAIVTQELMVYAVKPLNPQCPVIFGFSGDPVTGKLVDGLARPGGNFTGMSYLALDLVGKRVELLKDWLPDLRRIAILARPQHPGEDKERQASQAAAEKVGLAISYHPFRDAPELDGVLRSVVQDRCDAIVVFPDTSMFKMVERISSFAIDAKLPTVSGWGRFAEKGLLLTYGPNLHELYRSLGRYVDRVLRGTKPSELPVELPTKFELVVNLKTAKALGLTVPRALLATADQMVE